MKLYSSLVYREFKQTRKHFIVMLILLLLLLALMLMSLFLSTASGDLENNTDINAQILFCAVPLALLGGIIAGTGNGLLKADIGTGWKRYAFVLPPTAKQKAFSNLLTKLCYIILFGLVISVYPITMYCLTGGNAVSHMLNFYLGGTAAALLIDVAYSYIVMFARTKKDLAILGVAAFVGAGLILKVFDIFLGDVDVLDKPADGGAVISDEALNRFAASIGSKKITLCAAAAFVVICAVYFLVMWRSHERREP